MMQFKYTQCPCCKHPNPIPFRSKTSMGLWSEKKCSFCQCRLREHRIVATIIHLLCFVLLPFGFIAGVELFQLFFASEFGLSLGYFMFGSLLGMTVSGFLVLWLFYILVPFVKVVNNDKN